MPLVASLDELIRRLGDGLAILIANPFRCDGVWMLQIATSVVLAGVAFTYAASAFAASRMRRCTTALQTRDERVRRCYAAALRIIRYRETPELRIAAVGQAAVFTTGYLRPTVAIAREVADAVDDEELTAVFLHELEHAHRRDVLMRAVVVAVGATGSLLFAESFTLEQSFVARVFRFDVAPALLFATAAMIAYVCLRRSLVPMLEYLQEIACDDRAASDVGDPAVVASAIVRVARLQLDRAASRRTLAHCSCFVGTKSVERRVTRLLDGRWRYGPPLVALARRILMAGFLVALMMRSASLRAADRPLTRSMNRNLPVSRAR